MPETMGSGAAFIDYDGDGYQDIFLVNSRDWSPAEVDAYRNGSGREHARRFGVAIPAQSTRRRTTGALYHNKGDGTFEDVTARAGLDIEMYGMGASVGDYDNDGRDDLYVTGYGRNYLFRNQSGSGKPRFQDVTQAAGVRDVGWSTSAAWLDYDRDGRLDLFVGHYIEWSPSIDSYYSASANNKGKSYMGPKRYHGQANRLYRNVGGGKFQDVSRPSGIRDIKASAVVRDFYTGRAKRSVADTFSQTKPTLSKMQGKSLGVVVCDYNNDGWPDILSANDEVPNYLFENRKGHFSEVAARAGIAYSSSGGVRAGMGADAADIDHSGRDSIVVGNYSDERIGLYHNNGEGAFADTASYSEVGGPSAKSVVFGCIFLDVDNDGWPDIFSANGHVQDDIKTMRPDLDYAQRPLLFLNRKQRGNIKFAEIGLRSGAAMSRAVVGRGLACADIDLDGDVDVLLSTNGGSPLLLRNEGGNKNRSIRLILQGSAAKGGAGQGGGGRRSAIGARVRARVGRETLHRMVRSGSSYLSQSELPLTLGLGQEARATQITVTWPDGSTTQVPQARANTILTIQQGKGVISQKPFPASPTS